MLVTAVVVLMVVMLWNTRLSHNLNVMSSVPVLSWTIALKSEWKKHWEESNEKQEIKTKSNVIVLKKDFFKSTF